VGQWANREAIGAFLCGCEIFLQKNRPDLVWTYRAPRIFGASDRVIVPTEFARQFYRQPLALEGAVLPLVMDSRRVNCGAGVSPAFDWQAKQPHHKCVTFVNPEPRNATNSRRGK